VKSLRHDAIACEPTGPIPVGRIDGAEEVIYMRPVLGILSLLLVLAVVGVIAKKQLVTTGGSVEGTSSGATTERQAQQTQRQIKSEVEGLMQQPRPMPDDK
jgi:hypothetical protein